MKCLFVFLSYWDYKTKRPCSLLSSSFYPSHLLLSLDLIHCVLGVAIVLSHFIVLLSSSSFAVPFFSQSTSYLESCPPALSREDPNKQVNWITKINTFCLTFQFSDWSMNHTKAIFLLKKQYGFRSLNKEESSDETCTEDANQIPCFERTQTPTDVFF